MYALFINISVRNWHFATAGGKAMRFLIEPVYCMTWIWTLHRAHNKSKSSIEEDNIWAKIPSARSDGGGGGNNADFTSFQLVSFKPYKHAKLL